MEVKDIIAQLKALRIPFKSERDNEGVWFSWAVDAPGLSGQGKTLEDSIDDMIFMWRNELEVFAHDQTLPDPGEMTLYAKVLISTDGELRECLVSAQKKPGYNIL